MVNILKAEDHEDLKDKITNQAKTPEHSALKPWSSRSRKQAVPGRGNDRRRTALSGELSLIHVRMKSSSGWHRYRLPQQVCRGVYARKVEGVMIGPIVSFVILGFILLG
jgi:tetrahydromethanopterin S-methyltransferase subunit A